MTNGAVGDIVSALEARLGGSVERDVNAPGQPIIAVCLRGPEVTQEQGSIDHGNAQAPGANSSTATVGSSP